MEKSEIEGVFLRDKEETRDLHRKMVEVGQEVESLKSEIEKVKKDAKQQKGLLAIAKKQLTSREMERAKLEKQLEEANAEVATITREREEAESLAKLSTPLPDKRDLSSDSLIFAASRALPVSPDPSSPAGSVGSKSNNPFERMALPATSSPPSQAPFLPFGDASQPAVSDGRNVDLAESANNTLTDDPFGFPQSSEPGSDTQPSPIANEVNDSLIESRKPTPRPDISLDSVQSPTSPEGSDQYVTPPTTANDRLSQTPVAGSSASPTLQLPTVEAVASHFPDIGVDDTVPVQSAGAHETKHTHETDLTSQLKEIEVEESDSESDSEDEVPLAELAKSKNQDSASVAGPAQAVTIEPKVVFDDIFGVTPPTATGTSSFTDSKDTTTQSVLNPSTDTVPGDYIPSQPDAPTIAGVSAFDEAMGIIPNTASPPTQQFSFDSAFDDNFDFASVAQFPRAPTTHTEGNKDEHFETAFAAPPRNGAPTVPLHDRPTLFDPVQAIAPTKPEPTKTTFDEAFLGFDSGPTLDLNNSFSSPTRQATTANQSPVQVTYPVSSSPVSQKFSSPPSIVPNSPGPRAKSPPPRVSSPKPRPSTSSSKETTEKLKDPPTRHSKLSVRIHR